MSEAIVTLKQRITMSEGELRDAAMLLEAKGLLRGVRDQGVGERLVRVVLVLETADAPKGDDIGDAVRAFDTLWNFAAGKPR